MPKSISKAISEAVLAFAKAHGNAAVHKKTGIPTSTIGRWVKEKQFGLNTKSLDAVCQIEEVRASAASALLKRPDADVVAWEAVAGELSELLTPAAGWTLVRKLKQLDELGLLDSKFSVLEGAIKQRLNAASEHQSRRKPLTSRAKKKRS